MKNYEIFWNGAYPLVSYFADDYEKAIKIAADLGNADCIEEPYNYYEVRSTFTEQL